MTRAHDAAAPEAISSDERDAPASAARPALDVVALGAVAPANEVGVDALRRALSADDRALIDLLAERFAAAWLRLHR